MSAVRSFVTRRRGRDRLHVTDILSYGYLLAGVIVMFGPVIWLVASSFKTPAGLLEFPPTFLPYSQVSVEVPGYDEPLPLFEVRKRLWITSIEEAHPGGALQLVDDEVVRIAA